MTLYVRNSARGDFAVSPGVVKHSANQSVFNVLAAANPDAFKIVPVIDENLDEVLLGIGGISKEEIAVLPPNGLWVAQALNSNPWINYGDTKHTQEIVLRSIDAKDTAILAAVAPERLAQIQADTAKAVEAALADNFEAIPEAVREEFKTDPLR